MLQQQNVDADEKQPMVGGANGEEKVANSVSAGDDDGQQSQSAQQSQLKPIAEAAGIFPPFLLIHSGCYYSFSWPKGRKGELEGNGGMNGSSKC
jgi:hypothetical protein